MITVDSLLTITRTRTGNPFELWRVRIIESIMGNLTEETETFVRVMEISNYRESTVYSYSYYKLESNPRNAYLSSD